MWSLYRIAIVEDNQRDRVRLRGFLDRYREENNVVFQITESENSLSFLEHYRADYDVILLDIEMPHLNGMEMARQIRKVDENVCLIFTTGLAKYAMEGYEVHALDYILKPVEYPNFSLKLRQALRIRDQLSSREICIQQPKGIQRLRMEDIHYIEVINHTLYYHLYLDHQVFEERGSIAVREKELERYGFARCNVSFLLNLRYVTATMGNKVISGGKEFTMSRTKRMEFLEKLTGYLGQNAL
mgnify:FL=1